MGVIRRILLSHPVQSGDRVSFYGGIHADI